MLPKNEHAGQAKQHQRTAAVETAPPPPPTPSPAPAAIGKVSAARAAVQQFLATELGAREIRITKIAPLDHGTEGWSAEAEVLVPNLEMKMLGLPLTQEVLEREQYSIELELDLTVRSYGHLAPGDD